MANPDVKDGFLPVPHEMFAALMLVDLTSEARIVLCEIVAQRYGPAKRQGAKFKQSELAEQAGILRPNLARGLRALMDRGMVLRKGMEFHLVTDYETWTKKGKPLFPAQRADYVATAPGRAAAELFAMRSRMKSRRGQVDSATNGSSAPPLDGPLADLIAHRHDMLRSMSYAEYLQTPHWAARREATLKAAGGRCRVCNSPDELNVHHRTYERFGDEADDDLLVLCRSCHQLFHDSGKLAKP